ncbi:helix-turn-helix transcriptional regulator [Mammaliicoccus lentus]|uniref:helix-turn-helix domain-containing protein n=1 Tax=Enterococcus faecalis TaxID=1351 RepID=UPI000CF1FB3A|nr:helix-turn-helix transcriptional regulator [Enterococcus faecalis]EKJ3561809.1 helix-turn-helix transcriptional regulator [Enterococcus faecalis]PQG28510.1 XRE family transcriptional regulator [Enterococcus faecalis]HDT8061711.1 helix-turn-helix transcriptional regulator [Enterococcus faecalis]
MSLKAARVNAGFTSKEAAKAADVHFQTLSKYEKDSSDIPFSLLNELSNLYRVPIVFLTKIGNLELFLGARIP